MLLLHSQNSVLQSRYTAENLVWVTSFLPLIRYKGGYHEMTDIILIVTGIISSVSGFVVMVLELLRSVREGKRRRSEKAGKHYRP